MKAYGGKIKNKIISDLKSISNLNLLNQIFEYLRVLKLNESKPESNREAVLSFAGSISNEEAKEIQDLINSEFNNIEGDW